MDRPFKSWRISISVAALAILIAGCASMPGGPPPTITTPEPNAAADAGTASNFGPATDPEATVNPGAGPESASAAAPRVVAPDAGLEGLPRESRVTSSPGDEFHLSDDTGWLVLPSPRIVDDLPVRAASAPDARSELLLGLLPLPRVPEDVAFADAAPAVSVNQGDNLSAGGNMSGSADTHGGASIPSAAPETIGEPATNAAAGTPVVTAPGTTRDDPVSSDGSSIVVLPAANPPIAVSAAQDAPVDAEVSVMEWTPGVSSVADVEWVREYTDVVSGSEVAITLPGTGWIYVGREYGVGTAELVSKRLALGNDEFLFRFSEAGDYGLWFQREDPLTRDLTNERLEVTAIEALPASVSGPPAGGASGVAEAHAGVTSGSTWSLPDVQSAVAESVALPTAPVVSRAAAEAAEARGATAAAAEMWAQLAQEGGADAAYARERLFALAGESPDTEVLEVAVDLLRDAGELPVETLLSAGELAVAAGAGDLAVSYFGEVLQLRGGGPGQDELYFRLARLLEQPGDQRDLIRAKSLYEDLLADFPLSRYWEQASERVEYLDRHFFEVR